MKFESYQKSDNSFTANSGKETSPVILKRQMSNANSVKFDLGTFSIQNQKDALKQNEEVSIEHSISK
jgi:hypothetical protein